ncbi:methylamine utilization protein [Pseudidiomarina homiensis]|uniref:methylamine utilization protein n=1 Tax=Pseudidiomarina homiensis TaxID=364198 RepID=UPI00215B2531|nr:methylamine utilization protein [Pseudidiomarina homiensis]
MLNFQISLRLLLPTLLFVSGLTTVQSQARELEVVVTDANGQALPQAVVSIDFAATEKAPTAAIIDQVDRLFTPFISTIQPGSTVNFPNSDNIRHQVYSFSPAKTFELPLYSNREAPAITFPEPGIVVLGCNIHDHMRAYLYVSPHAQSRMTDGNGRVLLDAPSDDMQVHVWYPGLGDETTAERHFAVSATQQQLRVTLNVTPQQQNPPPPSPLQQRFNKLKDHAH